MSDNEIDAELLALAGDDSSSDDEDTKPTSKSRSPSEEPAETVERADSQPRRGLGSKLKSRGARGAARKRRKDDSEEEGEASTPGSSPKSLGSAAMSESRSVSPEADFEDDAPLYPIEGKYRSEADRADIMGMTEIQREEILAERAAEVQRKTQDQQLKRLLAARSREDAQSADKRKRKAGAADLEDGQRKSSRQKVKASEPLEAYKRQRELKGAQRARDEDRRKQQRSPSPAAYSDRDADGESEVEWDDRKAKASPAAREEPPPELKDFERIRVGRTNFAKVCFYPTFDLIRGCYCRVSVGIDHSNGQPIYRMGSIRGFKEGRPYPMDGPNNKKVYTDQYAVVSNGKQEKEYPFAACSDGRFTDSEFTAFKKTLDDDNMRFPTRKMVYQKLTDIHSLLDHQWTDSEIQEKINKANEKYARHANYGRERIEKRRKDALSRGDDVIVAKCDAELVSYDANGGLAGKPAAKTAAPNKAILQQERLAALNKANRKANSEEIRKAQIAEKRAQQKGRDEAMARQKRTEEEAKNKLLGVPKRELDDLFGDASDISRAGTPLNGTATPIKGVSRSGTPMNGVKEKKTLGGFKKKNMDDDAIAAMDLGIDIDIDI